MFYTQQALRKGPRQLYAPTVRPFHSSTLLLAVKELSPTHARLNLEDNIFDYILDVRETEEVRLGTIPGSLHIPLGTCPLLFD